MRFKELRGLGVALLLAILDGVLIGLSLHAQDRMKLIVALLLSFLIVISLFMQFYIRLFDDGVMCYRSYIVALLPQFVTYDSIQTIEQRGKHHVCLHTDQKTYHLYVWKADKLRLQIETKTKAEV
ncbi:MAG TPA: hypothetical protein IAD15_08860 [Candidatus Fimiplasma intestinipullorum]|uniref:Uncharacterized protein n=1 Tax=Candidatus Fimiplasma intestinipullorum TaxID=2840825 RepID=A0A9D1HRG8_9FIRM|nr:hypothetical protein [Candidatus Fimiplasma intestinipullorum]